MFYSEKFLEYSLYAKPAIEREREKVGLWDG